MSQACLWINNGDSVRVGDYVAFEYMPHPKYDEEKRVAMARVVGLVCDGVLVAHPKREYGDFAMWKVERGDILTLVHPSLWQRLRWRFK